MATAPGSEVAICNLALAKIRQPGISSLTDPKSPAENACALQYHTIRREVLAEYSWAFASARASIPADAAVPDFGFTKQFTLPPNILRFISRHESDGEFIYPDTRVIEGRKLLLTTDATTIYVRYVKDHTDVTQWHPVFVSLVVTTLAIALAPALVPNPLGVVKTLDVEREALMSKATTAVAQEVPIRRIRQSGLLDARRF